MSAERLAALAATYRNVAQHFGADQMKAMLAHHDAATAIERAGEAIRVADQSATLEWVGLDMAAVPDLDAFYQPVSGTVAVLVGGELVEFGETEAEAIHDVIGNALTVRRHARELAAQAGGAA
ncbi:MAG TPA: hypothetical protein VF503_20720 [Sphingobium sp.]|uniref:hypothetical protein n=1 Tax=Sphingobium sp. TaxID=1912891 RepID=UPI002ED21AB5